jgi:hypothetical protein
MSGSKPIVENLYNENYRAVEKEDAKGYLICLWIGRINIVKMAILTKVISIFKLVTTKIPMILHTEIE